MNPRSVAIFLDPGRRRRRSRLRKAAGLVLAGGVLFALGVASRREGQQPLRPPGVHETPASTSEARGRRACLHDLERMRVSFQVATPTRGVETPVEVTGSLAGLTLVPRGKRVALMDCQLARALAQAAPLFRGVGVDRLYFSAAYDYRNRRRSKVLSAHADGLAIDVHELGGPQGILNVARDFEGGVGRWKELDPAKGDVDGCIGHPRTQAGRRLRELACRLKHHRRFGVIITPDDDTDHRDHLHLEALPEPADDHAILQRRPSLPTRLAPWSS